MIRKIWKKSKLNSEKMWTMRKKSRLNSEKIWKIWKKSKLNSEKIWKMRKKSRLNCEKSVYPPPPRKATWSNKPGKGLYR